MSASLVNIVKNNDLALAKKLITEGADVNQKDSRGNSLLIVSAADGHAEMVELLLESGADINAVDASMKATALHAAAYLGHPEVMQVLIERGIDIDAQGPYNGYTALHDAVWQNNVEGVRILCEGGADVNIRGNDSNTPLDLARQKGQKAIIKLLESAVE